ncbi:hypothetical protein DPX16_22248 [Anabarilius grahami]|uniref:Uncharacterized protein n=1 Tax=Anabarilius grahami TaxID=495550 RepID=A0A3N0XNS3_ANAGA|nr:hypothetical protein DPX16_22248 [Anabarilius grahami]
MTESFSYLPLAVHEFSDGGKWRLDESFHSYREKKKCVEKLWIHIWNSDNNTHGRLTTPSSVRMSRWVPTKKEKYGVGGEELFGSFEILWSLYLFVLLSAFIVTSTLS